MLHGIGTFIFQIETMKYLPAEAYQRYAPRRPRDPRRLHRGALPGRHAGSCGRSAPMGADVCDVRVLRRQSRWPAASSDRPRSPAPAHRPRPADAGGSGHGGPHLGRCRAAVSEIRNPDRASGRDWRGASLRRVDGLDSRDKSCAAPMHPQPGRPARGRRRSGRDLQLSLSALQRLCRVGADDNGRIADAQGLDPRSA